jgi:hypothetical protein
MSIRQGAATEQLPLREAILRLSDERDTWLRRLLGAWSDGFRAGRQAGFGEGYDQALADEEEAWQQAVRPLRPDYERASAARRLRAAEAGSRRDAAGHERAFVVRAHATPARMRTDPQAATVQAYPPPGRKTGAA